jgi:transcriptional regulator with XRE-family HTH domain
VPRRSKAVAAPEKLIGLRIADLRKRRGKTQVELAAQLSMSQALLSRYERGSLRLHGALVADLARTLCVSADEILGLKDLKPNGALYDRRFLRRLEKIGQLPRRRKQALLMTIDSFLQAADNRPRR